MSPPDSKPAGLGPLLRPDQIAAELGVSRRHIYRLIARGSFDVLPVGRVLRVTRASFEAWQRRVRAVYRFKQGFSVTHETEDDPGI